MANKGNSWAIVPAGGTGSRYDPVQDKLLVPIAGVPVLVRTVQALLAASSMDGIVMACSVANRERYQTLLTNAFPDAPVRFTLGGATRRESVYNGLQALPPSTQIVAVHDAARPLIQSNVIEAAIQQAQSGKTGVIVAIPVYDTVKAVVETSIDTSANPIIAATLDRSRLWRAQTPQVFQLTALLQAHQQVPQETPVTDDAQLLELAGLGPVSIVSGDERNLKITRPIDIVMAEAFLQADRMALL